MCGHATLAAATVLFAQSQADTLEFTSTSATLTAERTPDRGVALTFPLTSTKPSELAYARVAPLAAAALSCAVGDVLAVAEFDRGPGCTGVVVEISADVDLEHAVLHLSHFKRRDTHMAIVTQAVGGGEGTLAVRSRVFVPFVGVDEDPVVRIPWASRELTPTPDRFSAYRFARLLSPPLVSAARGPRWRRCRPLAWCGAARAPSLAAGRGDAL